jgi:hypothetical protein
LQKQSVPERRQQNGGRPAWLNREIKAAINRKRRLWKKAKRVSGVEEYREADKKVKNMIRTAKRNYENRLANEKGSSNRPFYANVKKKTKSRSMIGPLKDKENFWTSFSALFLQERMFRMSLQRRRWRHQAWRQWISHTEWFRRKFEA